MSISAFSFSFVGCRFILSIRVASFFKQVGLPTIKHKVRFNCKDGSDELGGFWIKGG